MRRVLLGSWLMAACYTPSPPAGSPCPDGVCPTGLVCSAATQTCEPTSRDPDGGMGLIDSPDAPLNCRGTFVRLCPERSDNEFSISTIDRSS